MITIAKFNTAGEGSITQWDTLFQKAWNDLATNPGGNLLKKDDKNSGSTQFSSIRHYLSYIEQLIAIDPIYLMLPIDEAPFKINADTREIEVPRDFAQCSGVEADNYAEIITFTVDRYFDYKDLSEASIAVQWRNANANTEGLTLIRLVDLETYGADNKIRFGWPLTKEMTAAAGNLEFAVRFFTKDENNEFNYLLNTTPKSIPIKSTLTLKPDMEPADTDMDYFRKFVNNSQNPTYELAAPVSFYTDLEQKASINLSTNSLDLIAQAVAQGNSPISYTWYFKPLGYYPLTMKDEKNKIIEKPSYSVYTKVEVEGEPVKYEEYTGDWPVTDEDLVGLTLYITGVSQKVVKDNDYFTIIDTDDCYSRYYPKNGDWSFRPPMSLWLKGATGSYTPLPAEGSLPEQQWPNNLSKDAEDIYEVYVKDSKLHINSSNLDIIGDYWVVAENVTGYTDDENFIVVNTSDNRSQTCSINPPDEIDIPEEEKLPSAKFLSTKTEENKISMAFKHDYSEPHRTYEVYKYDPKGTDERKTSGDVTFNDKTKMDNTSEYTVTEAGTYYFNIKTELNRYSKTKEKAGGEITFYDLPVTPSGMMYLKRNDWAEEIAVSNEAFVNPEGAYKGSYTITDGATAEDPKTYIATFGENTDTSSNQYELIVKRTDTITTIGNSQTLKYNWTLQDESGTTITVDTKNPVFDGDSWIENYETRIIDGVEYSVLKIRVRKVNETVTCTCQIENTIKISEDDIQTASSDIYKFVMK